MSDSAIKLSIFVYVPFDPEGLSPLFHTIQEALGARADYEILILDDGTGLGRQLIPSGHDLSIPIRVVHFGKKFGESVAVDAALQLTTGEAILTLPGVRPVSIEDITRLLEGLERGTDLVIGYRTEKMTGPLDQVQVRAFYWLTERATGTSFRDLSSGVRAFRREVSEEIALYGEMIRFLPILAVGRGYLVEEIDLRPPETGSEDQVKHPKAKPEFLSPVVYLNRLLDVLTLFFLLRFTRKPLRFFGSLGAMLLIPGLAIDIFLFVQRLFINDPLAGRPVLLLGILLTVLGVQTVSIGLIGEMIIFTHSREIRDYSIREVLE